MTIEHIASIRMPVTGCVVAHRQFGIGRVLRGKHEGNTTQVEVHWPEQNFVQWHNTSDLTCGFRVGYVVQDSPHSNIRRSMGTGTVQEVRTLANHQQVLVQFHSTGQTRWIPYESLAHVRDSYYKYIEGREDGQDSAERFRLKTLAFALDSWNQITGALDRLDVDPLPHQIDLVRRILTSGQGNWLIADDVGLGKTIEVGLLLSALERRRKDLRVLIVCPAGLALQWRDEMQERFRKPFEVFTSAQIQNLRSEEWAIHKKVIVSIDLAKLEDRKNQFMQSGYWDVVVFDEAHHLSKQPHQAATLRYNLAADLRPQTDSFLFLTGTPHQGHHEQFVNLLLLLRPDLHYQFLNMFVNQDVIAEVILRNRKSQVTDANGEFLFRGQDTRLVEVAVSELASQFNTEMLSYLRSGYDAAATGGNTGRAIGFVMTTYRKLASSSIAAIEGALQRRSNRIKEAEKVIAEADFGITESDAYEDGTDGDDDLGRRVDVAGRAFFENELAQIERLLKLAAAVKQDDRKLDEFLDHIKPLRESGQKLLIFTEYRGTQAYLVNALNARYPGCGVAQINGGMDLRQKLDSISQFNSQAQFMVSTEAGGEGINLHDNCHIMVNYDLPWNPSRLVQRAGRLYRYGQSERVIVFNLMSKDGFDNQLISLMLSRLDNIANDMAAVGQEFNEGLKTEILGGLLERVDLAAIMAANRDMHIQKSEEEIEEAVAFAKSALEHQEILFRSVEGYDPQRAAVFGSLGTEQAFAFLQGILPFKDIAVRNRLYEGKVLELELPPAMQGQFESEFGRRTVVRVAVDRQLHRTINSNPPVTPMDFASEFFRHLIDFAQSPEFEGMFTRITGSETGTLGVYRLRWQNDQGEPQEDEMLSLFLPENQSAHSTSPSFLASIFEGVSQGEISRKGETAKERKQRMDDLKRLADKELADRCTEHRHPNDLVLLAAADITAA